jgi:hypothetical protein
MVTTYSRSIVAGTIRQKVGAPAKTEGTYSFVEDPVCGYPEIVTIENLPTFVSHNEDLNDFAIDSVEDLDLIGEYIVTIKSEICVPDDWTQTTCKKMLDQYDVKIIVEPCQVSTFTATTSFA